ncbi:MAG: DUF4386 domain-containing protein [Bacteroidota bacterium]
MPNRQATARIAGILFLLQLIPYFFAHEYLLGELLYGENWLTELSAQRTTAAVAVLLELLSAFSFLAFAILLYRMMKGAQPAAALGYLILRSVEFGLIVLSNVKFISLVSWSQGIEASLPEMMSNWLLVGNSLKTEWVWINLIYMLLFCVNTLLFSYLLFQTKLLPRFWAIWGFLAASIAIVAPLRLLFGLSSGGMWLYAPIGLFEFGLAIWLVVRGVESDESG